jgi:hypothetical protein
VAWFSFLKRWLDKPPAQPEIVCAHGSGFILPPENYGVRNLSDKPVSVYSPSGAYIGDVAPGETGPAKTSAEELDFSYDLPVTKINLFRSSAKKDAS